MLSRTAPRALLASVRPSIRTPAPTTTSAILPRAYAIRPSSAAQFTRSFQSSLANRKGIHPESANPPAPNPQPGVAGAASHITEPSPLTPEEYYEYSEHYFNVLQSELERLQEEGSDVEAEYSAGVLNISVPAIGTYVLNKQPPNKQIWLSSPISGPKRYDWIVEGDYMHEKQESRPFVNGQWIYLRDGSNLTELLNSELTLSLPKDVYSQVIE
ncbi:hypothetical protein DTO013E5_6906 [Penicillium roqueforti]|uniref:ferroxidase n=1 Tax=Penicillium roqueforti (strain FM164) TaxID=1365484 RepID=W6QKF6_PENRF|nr:uncharacterized protein LCP9604111_3802 [Penicillium roqueforti]XP_057037656.1 uncharacterized protein N7518_009073 [Penicillium psychrosexuale]CDM36481.1 Frataxin-like [Penicillium roqueforti FM164]KAF9250286.1 hypothetical protein LCP9604111_3802 [Penicillium roqueforti]KAI1832696.1 hypothetical protein CBS147337_6546 [Penicillium roqueforti]KAI2676386.1 hypothetical protein LCP963914a_8348 [Penicillium roqueforti]KAI2679736.1 hypothetical protein CBS147355_4218 [Penicillium roqueforti]